MTTEEVYKEKLQHVKDLEVIDEKDLDDFDIDMEDVDRDMMNKMTETARFRVDKYILFTEATVKKFQFEYRRKQVTEIFMKWKGMKHISKRKEAAAWQRNAQGIQ